MKVRRKEGQWRMIESVPATLLDHARPSITLLQFGVVSKPAVLIRTRRGTATTISLCLRACVRLSVFTSVCLIILL